MSRPRFPLEPKTGVDTKWTRRLKRILELANYADPRVEFPTALHRHLEQRKSRDPKPLLEERSVYVAIRRSLNTGNPPSNRYLRAVDKLEAKIVSEVESNEDQDVFIDIEPIGFHHVSITVNLSYSAVTESLFPKVVVVSPAWSPDFSTWPGSAPTEIHQYFLEKNRRRAKDESLGVLQETSDIPLVRMIARPEVIDGALSIMAAPIGWDLFTVLIPYPPVDASTVRGNYEPTADIQNKIQAFMQRFLQNHPSAADVHGIDPTNTIPMCLEGLVVSKDQKVLLRKRSPTSTLGPNEWDVSFSGYARFDKEWCVDKPSEAAADLANLSIYRWASKEFEREVGIQIGNLEHAYVLSVRHNHDARYSCIMAFIQVEMLSDEMAMSLDIRKTLLDKERYSRTTWTDEVRAAELNRLLNEFRKSGTLTRSRGAQEREVHHTENQFIDFTSIAIREFLGGIKQRGEKLRPEAESLISDTLRIFGH